MGQLATGLGPPAPHPTAGAVAVGYRPLMVAYNLWLANCGLAKAKAVAAALRSPVVRALAFALGDKVQVSCNLLRPLVVGPAQIWDTVAVMATIARAELVGLVPKLCSRASRLNVGDNSISGLTGLSRLRF